jgi:hypothetical protein
VGLAYIIIVDYCITSLTKQMLLNYKVQFVKSLSLNLFCLCSLKTVGMNLAGSLGSFPLVVHLDMVFREVLADCLCRMILMMRIFLLLWMMSIQIPDLGMLGLLSTLYLLEHSCTIIFLHSLTEFLCLVTQCVI